MNKTVIPAIGFALTTALALPAMAQNNPSIEGYEGGHVAAQQTAFDTAQVTPSFDANGNQLASNQSLEGYNGNGPINANARFDTIVVDRSQYASNPAIRDDANVQAIREARGDFSQIHDGAPAGGR
ncbi:hypothetical protein ACFOW6_18160 [Fodinicurvata halophila]|uniref:Large exoproteins involved in heme utilization or adhesion n=1 Tax=Fodinicurvata halophila TaxID=1419723 RepID=A0ABV8URY1_9PROT